MWTVELIVIAVMIAFNSIFAGYEIALASVTASRLHALVRENRAGAAAALRMKQRIEASLAVVQLGITLVGATAAATGGAGAEEAIMPYLRERGLSDTSAQLLSIVVVVAPLTILTIIFGELVPKVFALRNKEWVCLRLSPPMEWFSYSVWPVVRVLEGAVAWLVKLVTMRWQRTQQPGEESVIQEIRSAASLARLTQRIGHHEEGIIISASRLAETPVEKIMLPAEFINMLEADQSLSEALSVAHQNMHTRFPVTREAGNVQKIIGYVSFKDIVATRRNAKEKNVGALIRRLLVFDADTSVARCLEDLMRQRNHIALVSKNGSIVGMVTLEDIVEELVGEIHDEFEPMPSHLISVEDGWIVGGFISLSNLRQRCQIELPAPSEKPIYTLNDWIIERLGRPPRTGDEIRTDDLRIRVRRTRHILVQEAYIQRLSAEPAAEDEAT